MRRLWPSPSFLEVWSPAEWIPLQRHPHLAIGRTRNVPQARQSRQERLGLHWQREAKELSGCMDEDLEVHYALQPGKNRTGMSTGHVIVLEAATTTCMLQKVDIVPFAHKGVSGPMAFVCEADCAVVCKIL